MFTGLIQRSQTLSLISDIRGPKKMFPDLQFGCPDSDKVEARKSQLDAFLKVCIWTTTPVCVVKHLHGLFVRSSFVSS